MPKDSTRYLSSAKSARQIRARPMPDFGQLHENWGRVMEHRKQSAYKPTVPIEFVFGRVEKTANAPRTPNKLHVREQLPTKYTLTVNTDGLDQGTKHQVSVGAHGSDYQLQGTQQVTLNSVRRPANRVPLREASATKRVGAQRVLVANTDFVVDRIRSRLNEVNPADLQTPRRPACRVLTPRCTDSVRSVSRNQPLSTAKKPAQRVPLIKKGGTDNLQLPTESCDNVVRTITFDDYNDCLQSAKSAVSVCIPESQVLDKYNVRKASQSQADSEKTDSHNIVGNIYCDQPAEQIVRSSPSWHDNMLSAGKLSGVRSPLSVIGWSSGGRRLKVGDLAAKKAAMHDNDLASAKKAVAELIATVEMDSCKENASLQSQRKQLSSDSTELAFTGSDKPSLSGRVNAADANDAVQVPAVASSIDEDGVEHGLITEQNEVEEDAFDDEFENKENIFSGSSTDETVEMSGDCDVDKMVCDTVRQLDRQARTLRRRSQLSTDLSEYEGIVHELKVVRQRQAELERLQTMLHSRLLRCQPSSLADNQPLNLKVNSAHETESVDRDSAEPLDLRILSVKHENNERIVLADITAKIVGNADPDDCFEVPDSPPAAATDAEDSGTVHDVAEVDEVVPVCENVPGHDQGSGRVCNEGDYVESGETKSTLVHSSPGHCDVDKAHALGVLDQYLASLNVSDISEADNMSPCTVTSPDTSSEFSNYQTYQRSLDESARCTDPVAASLSDDEQHFQPITDESVDSSDSQ